MPVGRVKTIRLPNIAKVANTNITSSVSYADVTELRHPAHTHSNSVERSISALVSLLKQKPLFVTYHNDLTGQGMNGFVRGL